MAARIVRAIRPVAGALLVSLAILSPAALANAQGFGFGIGPRMYFGEEPPNTGGPCLSDNSLRQQLTEDGYGDIEMGAGNDDRDVTVNAKRNGTRFKLGVNPCSGRILSRERVR